MSPWEGLNRRKFPRVFYPCLITIRQDGEEKSVFLTHTENIGVGGVCVILKNNIKMYSPVEIELDLMDLGAHIRCAGKVMWSVRRMSENEKKPLFYDLGIEFVDISDADRTRVSEVVGRLAHLANKKTSKT